MSDEDLRLAGAFDGAPDGFALFDDDGRLLVQNPRFAVSLGIAAVAPGNDYRAIARAIPFAAETHPAEDDVRWMRWSRVLARRRRPSRPITAFLNDGSRIRVAEWITAAGRLACVVGLAPAVAPSPRGVPLPHRSEPGGEPCGAAATLTALARIAGHLMSRDGWERGAVDLVAGLGVALGGGMVALYQVRTAPAGALYQDRRAAWSRDIGGPPKPIPPRRLDSVSEGAGVGGGGTAGVLDGWLMRLSRGDTLMGGVTEFRGPLRDTLDRHGAGFALVAPIHVGGAWWGHLVVERGAGDVGWTGDERDALKAVSGLLAVAIGRAKVDAALARSEARGRAIVDSVGHAIVAVDAAGLVVAFNPTAERLFRRPRAGVLGRPLATLVGLSELNRLISAEGALAAVAVAAVGAAGDSVAGNDGVPGWTECELVRADGGRFAAEVAVAVSRVDDEPLTTVVVQDITDRKRGEADLLRAKGVAEAAADARNTFLNAMSHELRTPLNAIIGFSEMIKGELMGPLGTAMYRDFASDIHDSGRHLLSIINDVLDMSRIEAGGHHLALEPLDLSSLVAAAFSLVREKAADSGVVLEDRLSERGVLALADRQAMMKVLFNLISNGIKFTPSGGRVWVDASEDADGLRVVVGDTGVGIAPEALERVFEAFQQGEGGLDRKHDGAGLGLTVAKALMELHGGGVSLNSAPGRGTEVVLTLPTFELVPG